MGWHKGLEHYRGKTSGHAKTTDIYADIYDMVILFKGMKIAINKFKITMCLSYVPIYCDFLSKFVQNNQYIGT